MLRADLRPALRLTAAGLVSASAVLLFAVHVRPVAYLPLVVGILLGLAVDRALGRDLALVGVGLGIISTIPLQADLTDAGMVRFAVALGGAVLVPWVLSRFVLGQDTIRFPVATGHRWSWGQIVYLVVVVVVGYLLLPWYFLGSGAYLNWPTLETDQDIWRLLVGVNAVGTWDELFFVCIVFALYRKHFGMWTANVLQAIVFVSFLWELGYREWGPFITVPFALVQGWIFSKFKSLTYVLAVHLLFDVVVFAVLVHGHHPELFDVFVTAPR
ncbi:CPBP family intramembrane metalloprotease [Antribacter sp. KLBMP9083]|uniref:CPBP family intramembrane metalloprotease n=1 Tax=Antribacter soli TaxID=2910976 RepID=A0AA41QCF2_9MICO|nr:CPBP family intramembrane glutamic endopeptidase [Antribacter soli]MCF4120577.1 CPBP family intramembrane metalloprotease [Antribacter soli]